MSSKKDFGRKVVIGIHNTYINEQTKKLLVDFQPNIILFGGAIKSKQQVKKLIIYINSLYDEGNKPFIACDVEGGQGRNGTGKNRGVNRLAGKEGFEGIGTMSAYEMGQLTRSFKQNSIIGKIDESFTKIEAESLAKAKALKDVGIHSGLDIVIDLDLGNPIISDLGRAASNDVGAVFDIMLTKQYANQEVGIASCIKHLWGHGSSNVDSHKGTSIMKDEHFEQEVKAFEMAFEHCHLPMVMASHLICPQIDEELPCSLSKKCLQKARKMDFDGIIISDDIFMRALSDHYSIEEIYKNFFDAGGDMMIIGKPDYAQNFFNKSLYEMLEVGANMLDDWVFDWREREESEYRLSNFYHNYVA